MRLLFEVLLSIGGISILVLYLVLRRSVHAVFGGPAVAVPVLTLALVANAAALLLPGRGSLVLGAAAAAFLALALLLMSASTVLGGVDPTKRRAWWTAGALLAWCFIVDVAHGQGAVADRWPTYLAAVAVWAGTGVIAGRGTVTIAATAWTGALLLGMLTAPSILVESFWAQCPTGDLSKCSVAGELFRSVARSENYLAILSGFTLVAAVLGLRGISRVLVAGHSGLVLLVTGSRTGMLAVGVACFVVLVGRVVESRRVVRRLPARLTVPLVAAACGIAVWLVVAATPGSLSRRGAIWIAVRRHLEGVETTGVGVSTWSALQDVGQASHHYFHSGYVLALFSGGVIGIVLLATVLHQMLRIPSPSGRAITSSAPVVLLLMHSFTEVVWNPLAVDGFSWIIVLLLAGHGPAIDPQDHDLNDRPRIHAAP